MFAGNIHISLCLFSY